MDETPRMRVAEFSAKVGTSPDLLRAWERRYRLVEPARSDGGFRLYSAADEWRVRLMLEKLGDGRSAAEAAREVLSTDRRAGGVRSLSAEPAAGEVAAELGESLEAFDEERAQESLDRLFGLLGVEEAIRCALLPYLRALGERWRSGEISVAQEHYASRLLEGRLLGLAHGWNKGPGPKAVLACPPGEQHTLPLICFGLVLRGRGWRNVYLGADSPTGAVGMAAETVGADLVVLSAVTTERFEPVLGQLTRLGSRWRVVIAGAGATAELAARARVEYLSGDPTSAAGRLSVDQASKRSAVTS
ncbi:MAG: Transcriptional regulator, MerR family [uncultured Solirubrobacterales bacterium]|uniref:Transcriptional regulator, MerR family n=1 Tax=uncultured Solirubrobacterales bacterium TaxID=768556 RepID=A0A6J4S6Y5_9ACTN|nr:MAG: Transcriptional regulator, MerR family [uncultured Solirubrobacterales bacterium]